MKRKGASTVVTVGIFIALSLVAAMVFSNTFSLVFEDASQGVSRFLLRPDLIISADPIYEITDDGVVMTARVDRRFGPQVTVVNVSFVTLLSTGEEIIREINGSSLNTQGTATFTILYPHTFDPSLVLRVSILALVEDGSGELSWSSSLDSVSSPRDETFVIVDSSTSVASSVGGTGTGGEGGGSGGGGGTEGSEELIDPCSLCSEGQQCIGGQCLDLQEYSFFGEILTLYSPLDGGVYDEAPPLFLTFGENISLDNYTFERDTTIISLEGNESPFIEPLLLSSFGNHTLTLSFMVGLFPATLSVSFLYVNATDFDSDGVLDHEDNCPLLFNPSQQDVDSDGRGNLCDPAVCGNGIFEEGEICEGVDLNGVTCSDLGLGDGKLVCSADCTSYVTDQCSRLGGTPCEISSVVWANEITEVEALTQAQVIVFGEECLLGEVVTVQIFEVDEDRITLAPYQPPQIPFEKETSTAAGAYWTTWWECDEEINGYCTRGDPEYLVRAFLSRNPSSYVESTSLLTVYDNSPTICGNGLCQWDESVSTCAMDCSSDYDLDGVSRFEDNCPLVANPLQQDYDGDGVGDVCDVPECGNGFVEDGEACEVATISSSCLDEGFDGGILGCSADCRVYDTSLCYPNTCTFSRASWTPAGEQVAAAFVSLELEETLCLGRTFNYTIYEDDGLFGDDLIVSFLSSEVSPSWQVVSSVEEPFVLDRSAEYYFTVEDPVSGSFVRSPSDLYVAADVLPPQVTSLSVLNNESMIITFDEIVNKTLAESLSSYQITPFVSLSAAHLQADNLGVLLFTEEHAPGEYSLEISGITDTFGNPLGQTHLEYLFS